MKKTLFLSAAAALALAFTACSHYVEEPEYKNYAVDISDNDTDLGTSWSNTVKINKDVFNVLDDGAKITVDYAVTDAASYHMIKLVYNNLYESPEDEANKKDPLKGWEDYDGKYYGPEGNALSLDGGFYRPSEDGSLSIQLTKEQAEAFKKRGLIIQGYAVDVTGVTLNYIGDDIIEVNIKDFSKPAGSLSGKGKVVLDKDDPNSSVLEIVGDGETNVEEAYAYTGAADLSNATKFTLTAKADYDGYELTKDGDIVKKTSYTLGELLDAYVVYNFYTFKQLSDGTFKDKDGNAIAEGVITFKGNDQDYYYPVKISDIFPDYEDKKALAYGIDIVGNIDGSFEGVTEDNAYQYAKASIDGAEATWATWYNKWCCKPVYTEAVTEHDIKKVAKARKDDRLKVVLTSKYTDKATGKAVSATATYSVPSDTEFTGDFKDFEIPLSKFVKEDAFKFNSVTGFTIQTGKSNGTFFIKKIVIE